MTNNKLNKTASIELSIAHLIVLWDLVSNKLSDISDNEHFTKDEKRAIWAFEDLCENALVKQGYGAKPAKEWEAIIKQAQDICKTLPAEFLD